MPAKLLIKDASREQLFVFHAPTCVLGREPGCDLHFPDVKLSRRHVLFEVTAQGVRIKDLGTTNGSFVNGQRISEAVLHHNDKIRLGNLDITFLSEVSSSDAPTVVTPPGGIAPAAQPPMDRPESGTVSLDSQKLAELSQKASLSPAAAMPPSEAVTHTPSAEGQHTVGFDSHKMQQLSQQPVLAPPPQPAGQTTQMLGTAPPSSDGGHTVILGGPPPGHAETTAALPAEPPEALAPVMRKLRKKVASKIQFPSMAWRTKFVLLLSGMQVFLLLVIVGPLLTIQEKSTRAVSLERGVTLVNSLAARNRSPLITNQFLQLDSEFIAREPGVSQAVVLDAQGRILSPAARSGEIIASIDGVPAKPSQVRNFYDGPMTSGEHNLVAPIKNDNAQIVGVAWITFHPIGLSESASTLAVVLMLVIFLSVLGGAALVWGATNMTVKPLAVLRDDTEAVIKGDAAAVEELAGFAEINTLAQSINRLIERGMVVPAVSVSVSGLAASPAAMAPSQTIVLSSPGAANAAAEQGEMVVDGNFSIVRISGQTEKWLGAKSAEVLGKHVIEAVQEQRLLEVILDLVNVLATQPQASQEADFSALPALGGVFLLSASKSPGSDQTVVQLTKK